MRYSIIILALLTAGCASSAPAPRPAGSMEPEPKTFVKSYGLWESMYSVIGGEKPINSVKLMEDSASPDHRRQGIYELVKYDFGQTEVYCRRYRQIAKDDPDFTVRAAAVRALNWARDHNAVPIFITSMADPNELVRWEAAKGLSNVPDASRGRRPVASGRQRSGSKKCKNRCGRRAAPLPESRRGKGASLDAERKRFLSSLAGATQPAHDDGKRSALRRARVVGVLEQRGETARDDDVPRGKDHICSGCAIPKRSRPNASVFAVTSHNASRLDRVGSSD